MLAAAVIAAAVLALTGCSGESEAQACDDFTPPAFSPAPTAGATATRTATPSAGATATRAAADGRSAASAVPAVFGGRRATEPAAVTRIGILAKSSRGGGSKSSGSKGSKSGRKVRHHTDYDSNNAGGSNRSSSDCVGTYPSPSPSPTPSMSPSPSSSAKPVPPSPTPTPTVKPSR